MKQEKIAQDKKRETYRSISEVETVREDSKKLLSPKGAPPPTNRINMGIAVVDDKLYAIGGNTYEDSGLHMQHMPSAVNEMYTPIGYGTLPEKEPFPTTLVVAASAVMGAVVGIGLLVYFKKRKHW
jgi:hypothetical protein